MWIETDHDQGIVENESVIVFKYENLLANQSFVYQEVKYILESRNSLVI